MYKLLLLSCSLLAACTSLPNPNQSLGQTSRQVVQLLEKSAEKAGKPWHRLDRVEVAFTGEWTKIVQKMQPELVNAEYRKSSREVYFPRLSRVEQTHTGPSGIKTVLRTPRTIEVDLPINRQPTQTEKDAAALVADAYTMFVFGADYLLARGHDWRIWPVMQRQEIEGDPCSLVFGTLTPGVGRSAEDKIIAWISQRDHRLRRVQFTLNGLDSTAGADVDVTFSDFQPGPNGTEWPRHFLETVRRPLTLKAHEWRMTELKVWR
ncbi:MAG: hypothetical protein IPK22_03755 [Verrucomicrobiaceae bacterium]|nr:hypothetical protein [Verrucomicrobiaceae bacterium]